MRSRETDLQTRRPCPMRDAECGDQKYFTPPSWVMQVTVSAVFHPQLHRVSWVYLEVLFPFYLLDAQ